MQVGSDQWRDIICRESARFGMSLSNRQVDQMARHAAELLQWNRKINLTAITDPMEMAVKHCLDSIIPAVHIPSGGELLDMGTGGGFPGIPLKILRPDQPMTLVDTSRKKINFIKSVIRLLKLENISAIQMRFEQMANLQVYRKRFNVIVSRAFTDLKTLVQTGKPLLSDDGCIITYQGPGEAARQDAAEFVPIVDIRQIEYGLPVSGDRRALIVTKL